jgi:hypothetical protein
LEFISRSFQGGKVCGLLMPSQRSGITHWLTWQWKIMTVHLKIHLKTSGTSSSWTKPHHHVLELIGGSRAWIQLEGDRLITWVPKSSKICCNQNRPT